MGEAPGVAAGTPKLLELDKKDVEAVRSFLPGKVLGRTAALLALVVLVLGFAGSLDVAVEKFLGFPLEPPWLKYTLLIGLPVLIVGAQIAAEWAADRKRKQAQALAVKVDAVPEGYFRIGPYLDTAEDRAKFDRADRVHEKVLDWLKRADTTPLYLTGDSGSGKSSVLSAYALPELRAAGWTVIEARAWQDPEAALSEAIIKLSTVRKWKLGEAKTLRERLEVLARRADARLLLVLDQFEEFVILAGSDRQKAFTPVVEDLRAKPVKGLKLLLVLRSDYTMAIDELGLPLLRQGENWQEVGRFTIAAGTKFMTRSGLALESSALDRLSTSASELDDSPGMIRPITLNVVGHVLSQGRASAPSLDAGQLVRHYIEQSVEQPAIREFAPRVLSELVTEQGTKRPRSERELVDETGLRPGEVRAVMNGLWTAALARPLDSAQGVWELSHDFVARAVARYLGRRRLDVQRLIGGYAAPALFGLVAASAVGGIAWNVTAADRARAELANLGIDVSADGTEAATSARFRAEDLTRAVSLLSRRGKLQSLDLHRTGVANLNPLSQLTGLRSLNISNTAVSNLGPVESLSSLRELDLANTAVSDLGPLKRLSALQVLDISESNGGRVKALPLNPYLLPYPTAGKESRDLSAITGLNSRRSLNLSGLYVTDLQPLRALTELESLDVSADYNSFLAIGLGFGFPTLNRSWLQNIEPITHFTKLRSLNLAGTVVSDLAPLSALRTLTSLNIADTNVHDLGPLGGLTALTSLNLDRTLVKDLKPLSRLTSLQELSLTGYGSFDLSPVQDLPNLKAILGLSDQVTNGINAHRGQKSLTNVKDKSAD
jgi:hypothetical protein